MNNITINWSAEDRARIDKLIELLEEQTKQNRPAMFIDERQLRTPVAPTETDQIAGQMTFEEIIIAEPEDFPEEPKTAENEAPAPAYELADVMNKVQSLIQAGKKDECREIVKQFAPSVSAIPTEKFNEVMDKLTALEG